jgi:hypothetical protein
LPRALTAFLLILAPVGCEPEPEPSLEGSGLDGGTWPMELGQGELDFAPLEEGDALPYARGAQGGQHVFVAFRMHDLDPMRVLVQVTTAIEGHDDLVLAHRGRVTFEPDGSDPTTTDAGAPAATYVYAGWPAQIADALEHVGTRVRIDVALEDRDGRRARASQTIVIAEPE